MFIVFDRDVLHRARDKRPLLCNCIFISRSRAPLWPGRGVGNAERRLPVFKGNILHHILIDIEEVLLNFRHFCPHAVVFYVSSISFWMLFYSILCLIPIPILSTIWTTSERRAIRANSAWRMKQMPPQSIRKLALSSEHMFTLGAG